MSEIEKMYENAEIKPLPTCNNCNMLDEYWSNGTYCSTCKCDKDSDECNMANYIYPPFTAEKQIELIKWLGALDMLEIMRTIREDKAWIINSEYGMSGNVYEHTSRMKSFEEALASLINSLWQDLTESEQKQIRSILE